MSTFSYIASNAKGESVRGTLQANSRGEVAKLLSGKGLFLVSCKIEDISVDPMVAMTSAASSIGRTAASAAVPSEAALAPYSAAKPNFHKWWDSMLKTKV